MPFKKKEKKITRIQVQQGHKRFWVKDQKKIKRWERMAKMSQGHTRIVQRTHIIQTPDTRP